MHNPKPYPNNARCRPVAADRNCHACARWVDHPDHPVGHVVPVVNTSGSRAPACRFLPAHAQALEAA